MQCQSRHNKRAPETYGMLSPSTNPAPPTITCHKKRTLISELQHTGRLLHSTEKLQDNMSPGHDAEKHVRIPWCGLLCVVPTLTQNRPQYQDLEPTLQRSVLPTDIALRNPRTSTVGANSQHEGLSTSQTSHPKAKSLALGNTCGTVKKKSQRNSVSPVPSHLRLEPKRNVHLSKREVLRQVGKPH